MCREYSKQLNESRLKVLQARENAVHDLINEAQQGLTSFSKDQQKYKNLLADLLVQVESPIPLYAASTAPGSFQTLWHINLLLTFHRYDCYAASTHLCVSETSREAAWVQPS